jgi:hypothetical protein
MVSVARVTGFDIGIRADAGCGFIRSGRRMGARAALDEIDEIDTETQ